jgi:DNA invertase Pin-like site-specific DNA recombinase
MKVCIYARVSTDQQELDQQLVALNRFCQVQNFEIGHVYAEKISSAKSNRPEYIAMVNALRRFEYDGVVIFRIDRLGRNSRELVLLFEELDSRKIQVFSLHENLDATTPMGRFTRDLLFSLAQLEREQISEATRQRLTALKNMGKKLGPPVKVSPKDADTIQELRRQGLSLRAIARAVKLGKSTVARVLNNEQS